MSASVIYQLLALDLDPWFFKAVDKLRRNFFWAGSADAQSGCCSVAWRLVCQPKNLGGLGLLDIFRANIALRARWAWLRKTDGARPWSGLKLHLGHDSLALFNASVKIVVGSGASILFWEDAWINGLTAEAIAPDLCRLIRPAVRSSRIVHDGLLGNSWVRDIYGELSVDAVVQYIRLWTQVCAIANTQLLPEAADSFVWKWTGDGRFSSRSAYRMLFHGSTGLPGAHLIWNSFAPLKFSCTPG
jgi:hypothetical protein